MKLKELSVGRPAGYVQTNERNPVGGQRGT